MLCHWPSPFILSIMLHSNCDEKNLLALCLLYNRCNLTVLAKAINKYTIHQKRSKSKPDKALNINISHEFFYWKVSYTIIVNMVLMLSILSLGSKKAFLYTCNTCFINTVCNRNTFKFLVKSTTGLLAQTVSNCTLVKKKLPKVNCTC